MLLFAGQKPVVTKAKKSVANFKVRTGMNVGCMVTLRGNRMYEFLDKLISMALPRVRDFRGLNGNSFDGRGNYTFGIKEQLIFPEVKYDTIDKVRGFDVTYRYHRAHRRRSQSPLKGMECRWQIKEIDKWQKSVNKQNKKACKKFFNTGITVVTYAADRMRFCANMVFAEFAFATLRIAVKFRRKKKQVGKEVSSNCY